MIKDKTDFKILVIEDNPGDFMLVQDYLKEQISKPVIVHARNFSQSSSILSGAHTSFDIILLDLSLPDKSGQQLVTEILALASSCPVIILTGFADVDFSITSISKGISDYLLKDDLNANSLYKSIVYCMERRKQLLELKESEKRYSSLFHLSPQPMCLYDPETLRFIQVNKAAIEQYGYTEKEFLSMAVSDIIPEEDNTNGKEPENNRKKENKAILKGRYKHSKKSGELIDVEIYSNPVTINDKTYRSVIAIDVTEKTLIEHKITRAIIKTQEDERYEIGAELHDNVCQILSSSLMMLGMLERSIDPASIEVFKKSQEYITLATVEIRNLSHRLAPAFFDDSTLEEAFERVLRTFNAENKFNLTLYFDNAIKKSKIDMELQLNLYRILQEQLGNIQKYAKASTIQVDMVLHKRRLKMHVSDDGVGFDIATVKRGIGLANMKRRAELFFGKLEINSTPGNGCEIVVEIPLHEAGELVLS